MMFCYVTHAQKTVDVHVLMFSIIKTLVASGFFHASLCVGFSHGSHENCQQLCDGYSCTVLAACCVQKNAGYVLPNP